MEGGRGNQEGRGESKRERETNSLCAPQPGHPKRFTELGREEKRKRGDNSDLGEKKESQKGGRVNIILLIKNGY